MGNVQSVLYICEWEHGWRRWQWVRKSGQVEVVAKGRRIVGVGYRYLRLASSVLHTWKLFYTEEPWASKKINRWCCRRDASESVAPDFLLTFFIQNSTRRRVSHEFRFDMKKTGGTVLFIASFSASIR